MSGFTLFRRVFNLLRDILFLYIFLSKSGEKKENRKMQIPAAAAIFAMLAMYTAEDGGIFANPWIRFGYRCICSYCFIRFARTTERRTAFYISLLGDISVVLAHNVFLTPLTRPFVLGNAVLTGNTAADMIISFLLTNCFTALFYWMVYRLLPVDEIHEVNLPRITFAVLTSAACIYLNDQLRMVTDANIGVIASFSIFSVILEFSLMACIIFMEQLQHNYRIRMQETARRLAAQALLDTVRGQEKSNEKVRQLRHDMRNHLNSVSYLIETGKNDQAQKYIGDLIGEYTAPAVQVKTGIELLDGILGIKLRDAASKHIPVEIDADCTKISYVDDIDLCTIFSNAFDNALEAVSAQLPEEERFIRLKTEERGGMLVIVLRNTYHGTLEWNGKNLPETGKKDRESHGIGLGSIRETAARYNGGFHVSADNENHIFRTVISLPAGWQTI
ncbi:MAG: GHKL domain-containing protein [Solobacterium sp.]|nr:GHKL domain-containing protein [Solobacterium sp.]